MQIVSFAATIDCDVCRMSLSWNRLIWHGDSKFENGQPLSTINSDVREDPGSDGGEGGETEMKSTMSTNIYREN